MFPDSSPKSYTYSLLPTKPSPHLAVGSCSTDPPTPESFRENSTFNELVQHVIKENAVHDPAVKAQAATFASEAGPNLGSGGSFFPSQNVRRKPRQYGGGGGAGGDGAGGAGSQGGVGGAGRGGWVHVSDQRNPPDWGRIAWPEDIFGSLEVDGKGNFVGENGHYQESGTYRVCTNEGILGLSPYLMEKLIEKLKELSAKS